MLPTPPSSQYRTPTRGKPEETLERTNKQNQPNMPRNELSPPSDIFRTHPSPRVGPVPYPLWQFNVFIDNELIMENAPRKNSPLYFFSLSPNTRTKLKRGILRVRRDVVDPSTLTQHAVEKSESPRRLQQQYNTRQQNNEQQIATDKQRHTENISTPMPPLTPNPCRPLLAKPRTPSFFSVHLAPSRKQAARCRALLISPRHHCFFHVSVLKALKTRKQNDGFIDTIRRKI